MGEATDQTAGPQVRVCLKNVSDDAVIVVDST